MISENRLILNFFCCMCVLFSEDTEILERNRTLKVNFYQRLANMPLYFLNKQSFFKQPFYVLNETYDLQYTKNWLSFEVEIRAQGLRSFYFCFVLKNSPFSKKIMSVNKYPIIYFSLIDAIHCLFASSFIKSRLSRSFHSTFIRKNDNLFI